MLYYGTTILYFHLIHRPIGLCTIQLCFD
jgi:hypothetical protein